jgi:hypothetical protein
MRKRRLKDVAVDCELTLRHVDGAIARRGELT